MSITTDRRRQIEEAAFWAYVLNPKPLIVPEIAAAANLSESTVRKHLPKCARLDWIAHRYPVRERNYNSVSCYRTRDAYVPKRTWLADELRERLHATLQEITQ